MHHKFIARKTLEKLRYIPSEKQIYFCFEEQYRRVADRVVDYVRNMLRCDEANKKNAAVLQATTYSEGVKKTGKSLKNLRKFC